MKINPLHDQIIVKQHKAKETTAGGLFIPQNAQEKLLEGEILAVGEGKVLDNGTRVTPSVKIGQVVIFPKHSYNEAKIDGEEYIIIREENLLAVIEK